MSRLAPSPRAPRPFERAQHSIAARGRSAAAAGHHLSRHRNRRGEPDATSSLPARPAFSGVAPASFPTPRERPRRRWLAPAGALLLILGLALGGFVHAGPRLAEHDSSAMNVDGASLALRGYDPVAYVVEGRAVRGRATIAWSYNGAGYRFSSTANLARFRADPERHAPQHAAFSAWHAAQGRKEAIDPRRFTIAEGRLLLHRDASSEGAWQAQLARNIAAADADLPWIRYATPRALARGDRRLAGWP